MMNGYTILAAYVISTIGGGLVAKYWVIYLKKCIDKGYNHKTARSFALDWSIGIIERGIATTLIIWAPSAAGAFVGGWIALKFAANWEKREAGASFKEQQDIARHRLIGLIGSAVSMAVAIGAGVWAHPGSLGAFG